MQTGILSLLISIAIVMVCATILALIKQRKVDKNSTVENIGNHKMDYKRYSGKYSPCKKIGVADAEF